MVKSFKKHDQDIIQFVGERVKMLRNQKGLTQEELANESEVSLAQIKRIELGTINTSIRALERITATLNIKVNEFFEGYK